MYVKAAHRGRGIGGALMRYVIDEAAAQGCLRVEWSCLVGNEAARRFYRALGAEPQDEWTTFRLEP